MSGGLARRLRLTTSRAAYRRAGLVIGSAAAPTLLTPDEFDELGHERQAKLFADPVIEIAASDDGHKFKRISADDRAEALERYQEFMTERAEGSDTNSPPPQTDASTAPGAAAATGDDLGENDFARADALERAAEANDPPAGTASTDSGNVDGQQPAADPADAPVAAPVSPAAEGAQAPSPSAGKPSGRKSKVVTAAQTSEAKAAS